MDLSTTSAEAETLPHDHNSSLPVATDQPTEAQPDIEKTIETVRSLHQRGQTDLATTRYQIGVALKHHDESDVKRIAKETKCSKATLYKCLRVAKAWPEAEFDELIAKGNTFGHLAEVTKVKQADKRDELLDTATSQKLSTKALRAHVREHQPVREKKAKRFPQAGSTSDALVRTLKRAISALDDLLEPLDLDTAQRAGIDDSASEAQPLRMKLRRQLDVVSAKLDGSCAGATNLLRDLGIEDDEAETATTSDTEASTLSV